MIKDIYTKTIKLIFKSDVYSYPGVRLFLAKKHDRSHHIGQIWHFLHEMDIQCLIEQYDIKLVLDVGANRGQFATRLRNNIGYKGQIISFEPVKKIYNQLSQLSDSDPQWSVYNLALGERDGEQAINTTANSEFSSFLKKNDYSNRFGKNVYIEDEEIVSIRRLDSFLKEKFGDLSQLKIFLKMDTQGYDLQVFEGLGDAIHSVVALQSEVSAIPIYQNMPHLTESISYFEKAGFNIVGLFPVTREKSLRVIEFDCLMVKAEASFS